MSHPGGEYLDYNLLFGCLRRRLDVKTGVIRRVSHHNYSQVDCNNLLAGYTVDGSLTDVDKWLGSSVLPMIPNTAQILNHGTAHFLLLRIDIYFFNSHNSNVVDQPELDILQNDGSWCGILQSF
jgi:hypothetical protein